MFMLCSCCRCFQSSHTFGVVFACRISEVQPRKSAAHYKALMTGRAPPEHAPKILLRSSADDHLDDAADAAVIDLEADEEAKAAQKERESRRKRKEEKKQLQLQQRQSLDEAGEGGGSQRP